MLPYHPAHARACEIGLSLLLIALVGFMFGATRGEAARPDDATEPLWPTKEWLTSAPEKQGMDSTELARLVEWRMGRDSNPRYLMVHTRSRRAQSTTLAPI